MGSKRGGAINKLKLKLLKCKLEIIFKNITMLSDITMNYYTTINKKEVCFFLCFSTFLI